MRWWGLVSAAVTVAACSSPGTNTVVIDHETVVHDEPDAASVGSAEGDASSGVDAAADSAAADATDADDAGVDAAAGCARDPGSDDTLCTEAHSVPDGWAAYLCNASSYPSPACHKLDSVQWCCPPQ